jgi:hemerythrin-like metal-binding protein
MLFILDDAATHFAHEEALFKEWGYPAAEEHAHRHAQVTQALHEIQSGFERDRVEYEWIEAGLKVKKALIEHLLAEDMKYRDYRRASGDQSKGERC